ncbi:MAG: hypothetical protein NC432_13000 [Roseburia sp.]|nr:hypothetical protein [Roseburia sp.]MCM1098812.1 hypothetical protein [Ruminococcus flavefaciens]
MAERNGWKEKLEKALLWAATVFFGCIVVNLLHREPTDWRKAVLAGLTVGILNFLWNFLAERIRNAKKGKSEKKN